MMIDFLGSEWVLDNHISCMAALPLPNVVLFPNASVTIDQMEINSGVSIWAINEAKKRGENIFVAIPKMFGIDTEDENDKFYRIGIIARVRQIAYVPGYGVKYTFDGIKRGVLVNMLYGDGNAAYRAHEYEPPESYLRAVVKDANEKTTDDEILKQAYFSRVLAEYGELVEFTKSDADRFYFLHATRTKTLEDVCDYVAFQVDFSNETKIALLSELDVCKRAERLIAELHNRKCVLESESEIKRRVQERLDAHQREFYLREQLREIQHELGDASASFNDEDEYEKKIKRLNANDEIKEKLLKEVNRLRTLPPAQAESAVVRTYLDTVLEMPWNKTTRETFDLKKAKKILEEDHYGLENVKERTLEYLAVRAMTNGKSSAILCLVGPPGVGKTSVAKSIARALGRKYVRVSLGGINNEADIRGHRKTYVGAMEGRIMAAMKEVKTKNPLMLLDEIDKMGLDGRSDPSAALLEVLDYEQNGAFRDHYIEVPFDLSQVIFVTTANTLDTISKPLLDRMEIIELPGYTDAEKMQIAKKYLLKKTRKKTGMTTKQITISESVIREIIDHYTREAGVRKLEQQLEALCRKAAKQILENGVKSVKITARNIESYLGKRRYHFDMMNETDQIGIARGLAWTSVGGETLSIEVNVMKGTGKLKLTGQLGDVMQESAAAALSYIRSRADELKIDPDFYESSDIHIHVPEGAVPKDGPSAGITIATALVSAFTGQPVKKDIAMTGEITLRGRVLPIGGLREKSMAAYRAGIKTVIIPEENKPDIDDVPCEIRDNMSFIPVRSMDTVLENALR